MCLLDLDERSENLTLLLLFQTRGLTSVEAADKILCSRQRLLGDLGTEMAQRWIHSILMKGQRIQPIIAPSRFYGRKLDLSHD